MHGGSYLTNQFLIAMPSLDDPNFTRSVTYVCEHNADGAMGIVINRPLEIFLDEVLLQMEIEITDRAASRSRVLLGGPVQQDRGFVLHRLTSHWEATHAINDLVGVTTSRDILDSIAHGRGPAQCLVALGYAGWGTGQLEQEMAENAWLSTPADLGILFELPYAQRWEAAARLVGVDLKTLSLEVGHA
ncbi:MAG TPA: YqgE/AlgH family protein [Gammaproteobacteria bacterium]